MKRRCGLYIRVSTDNQAFEGESLDEQAQKLKTYCEFRGWKAVKIYREEGISGKDCERPKLKELIRDIENSQINTVIVKKIDRLSRSILDFERIFNFFDQNNIDLISLHENFDTSTAIGRAVIRIVLVFAQLEREQTAERTIDVLEYRAQQGLWNGGYPPIGYDLEEKKGLVVNEKEKEIVSLVFEKYLEFGSYKQVANFINTLGYRTKEFISRRGKRQGGKKFIDTSISTILKNPIYIGKVQYKGKIYAGQHETVVDVEVFNEVQQFISKNRVKTSNIKRGGRHNFLLEGLVRCGDCSSMMSPRWATSKGIRYFYYECTSVGHSEKESCEVRSISAYALEEIILKRIEAVGKNEVLLQRIISHAYKDKKAEITSLEEKKVILRLRLAELNRKGRVLVDKLADTEDKPSSRFVMQEIKNIEGQVERLEKEIQSVEFKIDQFKNYCFNAEIVKDSLQYFTRIFKKLKPNEKKDLMKLLIKEIIFTKEEIKIDFFEIPELELQIKSKARSFAGHKNWLPG